MERGEDYYAKHDKHAQIVYLKRRLEDLEESHKENKKQHAAELETCKSELERSRKLNKDQSEYVSKLKRQREASDAQILELKKAVQVSQVEARDLRQKVRAAEQERDKLAGKQTDAAELRKALNAAETKKKGDLQERERRVLELQKVLAGERQKAASVEEKSGRLQATLQEQAEELERSKRELVKASTVKEALQEKLSRLQSYLQAAFEQYALLAASTVSKTVHEGSQMETARLRIRNARLHRKLANADDQVLELAHLIRQVQTTNRLLSNELAEVKAEIKWRIAESNVISPQTAFTQEDQSLADDVAEFFSEEQDFRNDTQRHHLTVLRSQLDLSKAISDEQLTQLYTLQGSLADKEDEIDRLRGSLSRTEEAVIKLSEENRTKTEEIEKLSYLNEGHVKEITELKSKLEDAKVSLVTAEARAKSDITKLKEDLKKEREMYSRLHSSLQQNKMAEEALKAEIEQLSGELVSLEAYREAYQSIADEMRGLVARNALAEEEANRLSQFNAEILGHCNPTQKILYVDRIRRELAETKQKLAISTRDHESALQENSALRGELALFKSVAVPFEDKARTNMTRVKRIPLAPINKHLGAAPADKKQPTKRKRSNMDYDDDLAQYLPIHGEGDMTIDELS